MKKVILLLLLLLPQCSHSQILKERRVYYLDCSYSMVTNEIWDGVCSNLKKAIDNVNDETTELVVVPFALDHKGGIKTFSAMATNEGKEALKKQISAIAPSNSSMTYHSIPWKDFYEKVDPAKVTYMFFMTDGQNEESPDPMPAEMRKWGEKYGDKNVYGFYVMLHRSAKNANIDNICKSQEHLWKVETADININLIRLDTHAKFNVRNDKYVDVPITGDIAGLTFSCSISNSNIYKVSRTDVIGNKLRIYIEGMKSLGQLPNSERCRIDVNMNGKKPFTFLVTEKLDVECVNEKEYSLKVSVK